MAKGIFLTNPELNPTDVTVTASSELGERAGEVEGFATNSGQLSVTAKGDAGDGLAHDFLIKGSQERPAYAPLTAVNAERFTDPTVFATLGFTVSSGSASKIAMVACGDRLFLVQLNLADLRIHRWTGAGWNYIASISLTDTYSAIAACSSGDQIYIALANTTQSTVELYRYSRQTNTIGTASEVFISTSALSTIYSLAIAMSGAFYVLLVDHNVAGAHDVTPFFGGVGGMEQRDVSINATFATTWTTGGDVRSPSITYNNTFGFLMAVRCGVGTPASLRVAASRNGDAWGEFKNLAGVVAQPTTATAWSNSPNSAIVAENRRVYIFRMTATVQGDPPADVKMQWWSGTAWSAEVDVDGAVAKDTLTGLAACIWRGEVFIGWRSSSTVMSVRRGNALTTTNTGTYREILLGQPMFLAGVDDDTGTALFFVATGNITAGDKYNVAAASYDHRAPWLLDDFMSKTWRGAHNAAQTIQFDAGSGRAFFLDTVQIHYANLPSITVLVDDDVAFGSPSTNQQILATVQTAVVVSADRNRILFADGTFKEKKYAAGGPSKFWITVSTGTFRILDNTHNALIVDGSAAGATATAATIFRDSMSYCFATPQTPGRYLRLVTPTLQLPDGYYEISRVLFGLRLSLPRNFSSGFQRDHAEIETTTQLKSGARFQTKLNERQRVGFSLPFQVVRLEEHLKSIEGIYALGRGSTQLVGFCPFPTPFPGGDPDGNQPDVYIGRITEALTETHINQKFYSVGGLRFESEV